MMFNIFCIFKSLSKRYETQTPVADYSHPGDFTMYLATHAYALSTFGVASVFTIYPIYR